MAFCRFSEEVQNNWGTLHMWKERLSLCCDPFTFKASRPGPMFPPLFEGRLKMECNKFLCFFPLETWQVPRKKRKKNWSRSLLSIKPWVCANPYRLNPTTSGFTLHLLSYLHLELFTCVPALINAIISSSVFSGDEF
jgi:hypothetical protein